MAKPLDPKAIEAERQTSSRAERREQKRRQMQDEISYNQRGNGVIIIPPQKRRELAEEPPKLRVAAYCRVSTQEEQQVGSFDIAIQFTAEGIVSLFTDPSTADGAAVVRFGGQYLRGYIFDCIFAGIHFSFSGFFCACRKSGLSFLHNILAIVLMRVPGVYVTSKLFPATLLPMGLATAAGSLLSVVICLIAFGIIRRKSTLVLVEE